MISDIAKTSVVKTYNEEDFTSGNYADYLTRYPKYLERAKYISSLNLLRGDNQILDFGCGVGFMVHAMHSLGYKYTYGYDTSTWAIDHGTKLGYPNLYNDYPNLKYQAIFAFDVFEHIPILDLHDILDTIKTNWMFVKIPVPKRSGERFILDVSNQYRDHINSYDKNTWDHIFRQHGYSLYKLMNHTSYYDSEGVLSAAYFNYKV